MSQYIPFIVGVLTLLVGIFFFLFSFRILKPKGEKARESYEAWNNKFGKISKGLSIVLVIFGSLQIILNNPDLYTSRAAVAGDNNWTSEEKAYLTDNCVQFFADQFPRGYNLEVVEEYCQCSTEKMTEKFSLQDMEQHHENLSEQEKIQIYEPIMNRCMKEVEMQGKVKMESLPSNLLGRGFKSNKE